MTCRIAIITSCFLQIFLTKAVFSEQAPPSRDQVLSSVHDAINRYNNSEIQATCNTKFQVENGFGKSITYVTVRRSGSRALISQKEVVERPGQETWRAQVDFVVQDDGEVQQLEAGLDPSLKQLNYQAPEPDLKVALHSQRLAGKQTLDRNTVYSMMNDSGTVLWVVGYATLLDYLDRANNVQISQVGDDVEIIAISEYGRLQMVVSPSNGWLPRSFELTKSPENKTLGGSVAVVYKNRVKSVVWTGKIESFKTDSQGRFAPENIHVNRQTNWKERSPEVIETIIDIKEILYNPAFLSANFKSNIQIPEGFPVTVREAANLPYQWDGYAIVPGTSKLASLPKLADYENLKSVGGSNRWRTSFILFNVVALVTLIGIVLWKKKRKQES